MFVQFFDKSYHNIIIGRRHKCKNDTGDTLERQKTDKLAENQAEFRCSQ